MSSTGNKFPTAGVNVDRAGNTAWTNPGNVVSDNTTDTTVVVPSDYLVTSSYSLGVPTDAVILGVTVRVEASESGTGSSNYIVQLHSDTTPTLIGAAKSPVTVNGTTKVISTNGSESDLWSASLTPAIVNAAGFGCSIWSTDTTNTLAIDYVTIAVEWAIPALVGSLVLTGKQVNLDSGIRVSAASLVLANQAPLMPDLSVGKIAYAKFAVPFNANSIGSISSASLVLTGKVPVVEQGIKVSAAALILTGKQDIVSQVTNVVPAAGSLVISGQQDVVTQVSNVSVLAASLILTAQAPSVPALGETGRITFAKFALPFLESQSYTLSVGAASLILEGQAATASQVTYLSPTPGALLLTGNLPGIAQVTNVVPASSALVLTAQLPAVSQVTNALPAANSLVLTGSLPAVSQVTNVQPAAASLVLEGQQASIPSGIELGRIAYAKFALPFYQAQSISIQPASLVLTGKQVGVPGTQTVQPAAAGLTLTSQQPLSVASHVVNVFPASQFVTVAWDAVAGATGYELGMDVDSGDPYSQTIDVGNVLEFEWGPQDGHYYINVRAYDGGGPGAWNTELEWDSSGLILTGQQPTIQIGIGSHTIASVGASLVLTAKEPTVTGGTLLVASGVGSLVLAGKQPVVTGGTLAFAAGSAGLILAGQQVTPSATAGVQKTPAQADIVLTGQLPTLAQSGHVFKATDAAQLVLSNGQTALLVAGGFAIDVGAAQLILDGMQAEAVSTQPTVGGGQQPAGTNRRRRQEQHRKRWVLPNGMHVFGTAEQALEVAQSIIEHPVVIRQTKPKRKVTVRFDDGQVEVQAIYPIQSAQLSSTSTDALIADTQTAENPEWINAELIMRMLEDRKRRRRKAAALLLMS